MSIVGREAELQACSAFLSRIRDGFGALALLGEAGIGKTTILQHVVDAADVRVVRCRAVEAEVRLSFAGLADLLGGVDEAVLDDLPPLQRAAADAVMLRGDAAPDGLDLRVIGNAVRSIVRRLSEVDPLLIVIDDLQWIDPSSAAVLAFVLRRLGTERVGVFASAREEASLAPVLDERATRLPIGPMSLAALHEIIKAELGHVFSRPVMVRLERACAGNPFYAVAIARQIGSREAQPAGIPIPEDLRVLVREQLEQLPPATRDALLVASMDAGSRLVDARALEPAERNGIVSIHDGRVLFAHPLYASAIYASATTAKRRELHGRLGETAGDLEARARHLALAADGPDDVVADALEAAALAAARRGATAAAAELAGFAEQLTPPDDAEKRARRGIDAADHLFAAGDMDRAGELLARAAASPASNDLVAEALVELATVRWMQNELDEVDALGRRALETAGDQALVGAIHTRMSSLSISPADAAGHARAALDILDETEHPELVSFAMHELVYWDLLLGRGADQELFARGLELRLASNPAVVNLMPAGWAWLNDDLPSAAQRYHELLKRSSDAGDEAGLATILTGLSGVELALGRWDDAEQRARDALRYAEETGQRTYRLGALCAIASVEAHRGLDEEAVRSARAVIEEIGERSDPLIEARARATLGLVALSSGDPEAADAELTRLTDALREVGVVEPAPYRFELNHVETMVRLGDLARARSLVEDLERRHGVAPRPWTRAVALHGRGLISGAAGELEAGLADLASAVEAFGVLSMPFEEARSTLVLGIMQRRIKRRGAARATLTKAKDMFEQLGATHWAARARAELDRSGVRSAPLELTQTEETIARLASQGRTNAEIAEELFLSRRTVEDNLSKVYRKLGIRSRAELGSRLGA